MGDDKLATTKLWRVNPTSNRSEKNSISKNIDYAMNEEKTVYKEDVFIDDEEFDDFESLSSIVSYATNEDKTEIKVNEFNTIKKRYVTGINCTPDTAVEEFIAIKKLYNKTDGTLLYHGVQSFSPGEASPNLAHKIGIELAKKMWGEDYQVVVTTHCDKEHIHNHFVVNSVSFTTGKKYHHGQKDIYKFRQMSDELCNKYNLSVITESKKNNGKYYTSKNKRQLIKEDIDIAIANSNTLKEVYEFLENELGYKVNTKNKYVTLTPPGSTVSFRLDSLDKDRKNPNKENRYTEIKIAQRLINENNNIQQETYKAPKYDIYDTLKYSNNYKSPYKPYRHELNFFNSIDYIFRNCSFRKTYWRYYYEFKKYKKQDNKNIKYNNYKYYYYLQNMDYFKTSFPHKHFYIRSESRKVLQNYSENICFISKNHLENLQDTDDYKKSVNAKLNQLISKQRKTTKMLRSCSENEQTELLEEIKDIQSQITNCEREIRICNRIIKDNSYTENQLIEIDKDYYSNINKEENQSKEQKERKNEQWQQKMQL